jgi:hypothetical protein
MKFKPRRQYNPWFDGSCQICAMTPIVGICFPGCGRDLCEECYGLFSHGGSELSCSFCKIDIGEPDVVNTNKNIARAKNKTRTPTTTTTTTVHNNDNGAQAKNKAKKKATTKKKANYAKVRAKKNANKNATKKKTTRS